MQAKFDELAAIAESEASRAVAASRGDDPSSTPYRILMVGDSTMKHQFGAACGFLAERPGKRFDPKVCEDRAQDRRTKYRLVYFCCKIVYRAPVYLYAMHQVARVSGYPEFNRSLLSYDQYAFCRQ